MGDGGARGKEEARGEDKALDYKRQKLITQAVHEQAQLSTICAT